MIEALASHLDAIASIAPVWGLPLVFCFMAIESSFIPFPSEVVMLPAGFMAARGELGIESVPMAIAAVLCAGTLGSVAGAYVNYALAAKLGLPFLRRHGRRFFIGPEALDRACELFNRYGGATTFVCRLVPVVRQLISIPAGVARMPLGSFTLFTAAGSLIWSGVLALTGWWLGCRSAGMTYEQLVRQGSEMVAGRMPAVIASAVAIVLAAVLVKKAVVGRRCS